MRERILEKANDLFFRYGIKSVTMDDIARELGISKKTIYQHFADKDAIVYAGVAAHFEQERCESEQMRAEAADPIAEVVMGSEQMRQMLTGMNPSMFIDLKRYYPRAWALFTEFKNGFISDLIRQNLIQGIEMGLYRVDLNVEVMARLRNEEIELGFDPDIYPPQKFNLLDVQLALLDHFLRGVVTPKGLEMYENYKKNQLSLTVSTPPINSPIFSPTSV
ncbi:MAG: TetR/AcrR family transcriptional regulator [Runella slithyformis]|nr:MAG: TetR/AcrR family transcriptional regulator [Runella slithyformis]TAF94577.1 MAG: TetR/AcrR family transcriptional regulator [Runella sp.]TAG17862.1 MAG: TetR/AcrR family transcriptional regulator [Cytophagales bacterium]TAG37400.1 MAG: TetR/AcrR family transcriptional regulator [Cytophagia bacterium]TAE96039.1 MAG: TetR/AcrR family transcriptional regulator [Runella slithyformis]